MLFDGLLYHHLNLRPRHRVTTSRVRVQTPVTGVLQVLVGVFPNSYIFPVRDTSILTTILLTYLLPILLTILICPCFRPYIRLCFRLYIRISAPSSFANRFAVHLPIARHTVAYDRHSVISRAFSVTVTITTAVTTAVSILIVHLVHINHFIFFNIPIIPIIPIVQHPASRLYIGVYVTHQARRERGTPLLRPATSYRSMVATQHQPHRTVAPFRNVLLRQP